MNLKSSGAYRIVSVSVERGEFLYDSHYCKMHLNSQFSKIK